MRKWTNEWEKYNRACAKFSRWDSGDKIATCRPPVAWWTKLPPHTRPSDLLLRRPSPPQSRMSGRRIPVATAMARARFVAGADRRGLARREPVLDPWWCLWVARWRSRWSRRRGWRRRQCRVLRCRFGGRCPGRSPARCRCGNWWGSCWSPVRERETKLRVVCPCSTPWVPCSSTDGSRNAPGSECCRRCPWGCKRIERRPWVRRKSCRYWLPIRRECRSLLLLRRNDLSLVSWLRRQRPVDFPVLVLALQHLLLLVLWLVFRLPLVLSPLPRRQCLCVLDLHLWQREPLLRHNWWYEAYQQLQQQQSRSVPARLDHTTQFASCRPNHDWPPSSCPLDQQTLRWKAASNSTSTAEWTSCTQVPCIDPPFAWTSCRKQPVQQQTCMQRWWSSKNQNKENFASREIKITSSR